MKGYPPEVAEAVRKGYQWVQLNPENTFVLQDVKEDWMRYAIPMIAACLTGLAKKAVIENYENSLLNLGIHSFIHVTYGDTGKDDDFLPDSGQLNAVNALFRRGMTGSALVTTNPYAKAEVIQADTKDMFQYDKYREVNAEILSAGGISGIIVSGRTDDGSTFASAQVSMQTAAADRQADIGVTEKQTGGQLLRTDEQDQRAAQRERAYAKREHEHSQIHFPARGSFRQSEVSGSVPFALGEGHGFHNDDAGSARLRRHAGSGAQAR